MMLTSIVPSLLVCMLVCSPRTSNSAHFPYFEEVNLSRLRREPDFDESTHNPASAYLTKSIRSKTKTYEQAEKSRYKGQISGKLDHSSRLRLRDNLQDQLKNADVRERKLKHEEDNIDMRCIYDDREKNELENAQIRMHDRFRARLNHQRSDIRAKVEAIDELNRTHYGRHHHGGSKFKQKSSSSKP